MTRREKLAMAIRCQMGFDNEGDCEACDYHCYGVSGVEISADAARDIIELLSRDAETQIERATLSFQELRDLKAVRAIREGKVLKRVTKDYVIVNYDWYIRHMYALPEGTLEEE